MAGAKILHGTGRGTAEGGGGGSRPGATARGRAMRPGPSTMPRMVPLPGSGRIW